MKENKGQGLQWQWRNDNYLQRQSIRIEACWDKVFIPNSQLTSVLFYTNKHKPTSDGKTLFCELFIVPRQSNTQKSKQANVWRDVWQFQLLFLKYLCFANNKQRQQFNSKNIEKLPLFRFSFFCFMLSQVLELLLLYPHKFLFDNTRTK